MFALLTPSSRHNATPAGDSATVTELDLRALLGAAAWSRLPPAVRRRFSPGHAEATYRGHMELRCSAVGRIFAALARCWGGPLTSLSATASPATVRVSSNGRGGVVWERRFHAQDSAAGPTPCAMSQTVRSTKELDADGGLLERTDGGLSMSLDVLEDHGALVFESRRYVWVLAGGRLRLPIPQWLTPGTCRVAHTDLGGGLFRFTLTMVHPWWGETFHQSGIFADPHDEQPAGPSIPRTGDLAGLGRRAC